MLLDQSTMEYLIALAGERESNSEVLPPISPLEWLLQIQKSAATKRLRQDQL